MPVPLPDNIGYGLVVGRLLLAVADSSDPDRYPDGEPARGTITFTPSIAYAVNVNANPPVMIMPRPIQCDIDSEGYILGGDGSRGVWLIATTDEDLNPNHWTYRVSYQIDGSSLPSTDIEVPITTTANPIQLPGAIPVPSSPGIGLPAAEAAAASALGAAQRAELAAAEALDLIELGIPGPEGQKGDKGDTGLSVFLVEDNATHTYPARPGPMPVVFVGVTDPSALMAVGDTWINVETSDTPGWVRSVNGQMGDVTVSSSPVLSVNDKIGEVSLTKTDLGLGNVDNTSDVSKPISTAMQQALSQLTLGVPGTKYKMVAGVLRNTGGVWAPINDATHAPMNIDAVSVDGDYVYIDYASIGAKKVVSFVVSPDEALSRRDFTLGPSVGLTQAKIRMDMHGKYADMISWTSAAGWTSLNGVFKDFIFSAAGQLSFTHERFPTPLEGPSFDISVTGRGVTHASSDGANAEMVRVRFHDYSGTLLTTPTTGMRAFVTHAMSGPADPRLVTVELYPASNFWFIGIFEV